MSKLTFLTCDVSGRRRQIRDSVQDVGLQVSGFGFRVQNLAEARGASFEFPITPKVNLPGSSPKVADLQCTYFGFRVWGP